MFAGKPKYLLEKSSWGELRVNEQLVQTVLDGSIKVMFSFHIII